ncbi:MAG: clan AA aspartic protease [Dehalococcoidia bacterium]
MITGHVTARREARLRLILFAQDQQEHSVDAVIDTGFNGFLTLPGDVIGALGLRFVGARPVTLADGSRIVLNLYRARLLWHEHERNVLVLQTGSNPLVGMALLHGSRLIMDVVIGGDVTTEPLP